MKLSIILPNCDVPRAPDQWTEVRLQVRVAWRKLALDRLSPNIPIGLGFRWTTRRNATSIDPGWLWSTMWAIIEDECLKAGDDPKVYILESRVTAAKLERPECRLFLQVKT